MYAFSAREPQNGRLAKRTRASAGLRKGMPYSMRRFFIVLKLHPKMLPIFTWENRLTKYIDSKTCRFMLIFARPILCDDTKYGRKYQVYAVKSAAHRRTLWVLPCRSIPR